MRPIFVRLGHRIINLQGMRGAEIVKTSSKTYVSLYYKGGSFMCVTTLTEEAPGFIDQIWAALKDGHPLGPYYVYQDGKLIREDLATPPAKVGG